MYYAKAMTALITPLILGVLIPFGITESTQVGEAINILLTALGTSVMVYLIPNKRV